MENCTQNPKNYNTQIDAASDYADDIVRTVPVTGTQAQSVTHAEQEQPEMHPVDQVAGADSVDAIEDTLIEKSSHPDDEQVELPRPLKLFSSQPLVVGELTNTSFSVEPTTITEENAEAFFRYDHTPIKFGGGYCKGDHFEFAMAIPFDVDNDDPDAQAEWDDPAVWVSPNQLASRLKEMGINFVMVASRNHLRPKEKNGVVRVSRPKYHVYLPLAAPLYDGDKYVCYCKWCIETFNSDSSVNHKAQKIFGCGDNPNAFIESWSGGRYVDEVLTDDDLAPFLQSAKKGKMSTVQPSPTLRTNQLRSVMMNGMNSSFTIEQIKEAAYGLELDILEHVAEIPADVLDGKHHPCPACGGKDRFRLINAEAGAVLCNQCFKENCGDFIAAVQHYRNVSLPDALKLIADFLYQRTANPIHHIATASSAVTTTTAIAPLNQWQPFPLATLPCTLRNFVEDVSMSVGIDPANTAIGALAVLSGLIGRTCEIEIKKGHREYATLWCALVATSGGGKSPALNAASKPLRKLQVEAQKTYKKEYAAYKACSQNKSAANQSASVAPSVASTEPVRLRYITSSPTTEALLPILAENPYGITLLRDELSGFFKSMDCYRKGGSGDMQIYIEAHGGIPISVDRKTGERFLSVDTPSLAIIGGIQTEVLRGIVKNESELITTGFLARFLMAFPPPEPILWNDDTVDPAVRSSYEALINKILSYRGYMTPDHPGVVNLTADAWDLIKGFQHQQEFKSLSESNAAMRYVLHKAGMHCARLVLNLHIIKHASLANITPCFEDVSAETMREAIALTEWFVNEARRVYAMFDGLDVPVDQETMKVKAKIKQLGGRATTRDFQSGIDLFHDMKAEEIKNRLWKMVDAGVLSIQKEKRGNGREVEYYSLSTLNTISTVSGGSSSDNCTDDTTKIALSVDSADSVDSTDHDYEDENSVDVLSVDSADTVDILNDEEWR